MWIHCAGCKTPVIEIRDGGGRIRTGAVGLCKDCEKKRCAADLAMKLNPRMGGHNATADLFEGLFSSEKP